MSNNDTLDFGDVASGAPGSETHDDAPVDHWVTINHQHIPITAPQGKCPPQKEAFFGALGSVFKGMGKAANTNPGFIAALSAYESAWLGKHAQDQHNPFGLTAGGGKNLSFPSYRSAASYWLYHAGRNHKGYAQVVSGTTTIDAFLAALRAAGYNAVNKDWAPKIAEVYHTSIVPFAGPCGF
jgi:mannosyl-glycoprotein endo-beta-N-acetylglucosaminidase